MCLAVPTEIISIDQSIPGLRMAQVSIGGAFEVYQFARERNILPVLAFSMVSGEQITGGFLARHDPTTEEKLSLFRAVYQFNLDRGIQTKGQLLDGWVSCMPGIHPCNQIAVGLYLTANGNVVRCPGDSGAPLGNVQREKIADIWTQARQWQFSGRFNCGCPYKDGRTIPWKIYEEIEKIIKS